MSGIGKAPVRAAEPLGQPPSRPPPFQGGGEKTARPASLFGHRERSRTGPPDSSPFQRQGVKTQGDRIWKFCGGAPMSPSPGGGVRGRRFSPPPWKGGGREGVYPGSADRTGGLPTDSASPPPDPPRGLDGGNGGPPDATRARVPVRDPPPDFPPERGEERREGGRSQDGADRTLRHHRRWTKGRIAAFSLLPPFRGEVGRGVPAPPRANRDRFLTGPERVLYCDAVGRGGNP